MPKATKYETRADKLRRLTGGTKRRAVEVREVLDEFTENVDTIKDAVDNLDSADLDSITQQLSDLQAGLEPLADLGLVDREIVTELDTTIAWLGTLSGEGLIDPEKFRTLCEAHDALLENLDSFDDLKDAERYEGKGDDMSAAWDEVVSAAEELAEAADELDLDAEPVEEPEDAEEGEDG